MEPNFVRVLGWGGVEIFKFTKVIPNIIHWTFKPILFHSLPQTVFFLFIMQSLNIFDDLRFAVLQGHYQTLFDAT
jgi:hypothetical protein